MILIMHPIGPNPCHTADIMHSYGTADRTDYKNAFDFCQLTTDVYCAMLTNESARILLHLIYQPSLVHFHALSWYIML